MTIRANPRSRQLRRSRGPMAFAVAATLAAGACGNAAEFAELSRYLPANANAVIVINAEAVYASPIGQREGWRHRSADAIATAPLVMPPNATRCVYGAQLNIETFRTNWEAAAATLSIDPSTADVAKRHGGTTDALGSFEAAWIGRKTCVVKFAPRTFGLLTPASRQDAARWVASATGPSPQLHSSYLQQAIGYADTVGTEVILAVDLAGALREGDIRAAVARSEVLKGLPEDRAAAVLASVQGVRLGVLVGENLKGKLKFDFGQDAALFEPIAKELIIGILQSTGAMLEEFNQWAATVEGNSLSIEGELTPVGMRRLFSLLAIDAAALEGPAPVASAGSADAVQTTGDPKQRTARASLRYFRDVGKYVEDAQKLNRADSLRQAVMWIENYARKVENLPTHHVDPELIEYGHYVASTFRSVVNQAYGVAQKADAQAAAAQGQVQYRVGLLPTARTVNYGGYRMREYAPYGFAQTTQAPDPAERQQTQDEIYRSVENARQALNQLAADHEAVRKNLNERYGLEF